MKTYFTTNFADFSLIPANRPIDWGKIERMREELKRKNLTKLYPPVVNSKAATKRRYGITDKMGVVDGQHRYISCKLEGLKMYYKISDEAELDDIPKAASMQNSWKLTDYIHHYSTPTNRRPAKTDYLLLGSYASRNNFPISTSLTILCGDRSHYVTKKLKAGELKITRDWNISNAFADAVDDLGKYITFNKQARFLEAFLIAFLNKEYNHDKFMVKLDYLSSKIRRCSDSFAHLEQIEYLYNFNTNKKVKLNTIERTGR